MSTVPKRQFTYIIVSCGCIGYMTDKGLFHYDMKSISVKSCARENIGYIWCRRPHLTITSVQKMYSGFLRQDGKNYNSITILNFIFRIMSTGTEYYSLSMALSRKKSGLCMAMVICWRHTFSVK